MLDLNDILKVPGPAQPDETIINFLMQIQEGVNALTDILIEHKAKIAVLEGEVRLLRARTDPPKRSSILRV